MYDGRGKLICGRAWGSKEVAIKCSGCVGITLSVQNGWHVRLWAPDRLLKYLRHTNRKKKGPALWRTTVPPPSSFASFHTIRYFCPDQSFHPFSERPWVQSNQPWESLSSFYVQHRRSIWTVQTLVNPAHHNWRWGQLNPKINTRVVPKVMSNNFL